MAVAYFPATLALDTNDVPQREAEAEVFAIEDTAFSTPLTITDINGIPFADGKLRAQNFLFPAFFPPEGVVQVVVRSGEMVTPLTSISVERALAVEAASTAAERAAEASTAAEAAIVAREAAEAAAALFAEVQATNDGIMKSVAEDPESEFSRVLYDTIAEVVSTSGGGASAGTADIIVSGDSITAGGQTDPAEGRVIPYAELLAEYLGVNVYNPAVPGERMGDISVRQGGTVIEFTVPGGVIPAETTPFAVTRVSPAATEFVGGGDGNSRSRFEGTFMGVPVQVLYSGSAWTMARKTAASIAKPVPAAGSKFRIAKERANREAVHVFFGGRNGGSVTARTAEMVAFLGHDRFIVMDPLTGSADSGPSAAQGQLLSAYPANYYDMRGYMIAHGLNDEGITPTSQDTTNIGNNTVPSSLRVPGDSIHPNAAGQRVIARRLAEVLIARGLAQAGATFVPPRVIPLPEEDFAAYLDLPTAADYAQRASTGIDSLQAFSVRMQVRVDATGTTQTLARRNNAEGARSWHLYLMSSGTLRFQWFTDGNNATGTVIDSSVSAGISAGSLVWIRWDVNTATRVIRFYTSADGETWTPVGTDRTGSASSIFVGSAPLQVGLFAGEVHVFKLLSFDAATSYIDEGFDSPLASGWTLAGSASLVAS